MDRLTSELEQLLEEYLDACDEVEDGTTKRLLIVSPNGDDILITAENVKEQREMIKRHFRGIAPPSE